MMTRNHFRLSLTLRFSVLAIGLVCAALAVQLALNAWFPGYAYALAAITALIMVPVVVLAVRRQLHAILSLFRALTGTVISYQDRDYSFSLHWPYHDELSDLVAAHNALGEVLRRQRLDLVGLIAIPLSTCSRMGEKRRLSAI